MSIYPPIGSRITDHPLLYEINARLWVREFGGSKQAATLDDVPDSALDAMAQLHFDLVWLMGVWQTGAKGRAIALELSQLQSEYRRALPDWNSEDVLGSPYAVQEYRVAEGLGGPEALARLRGRLAQRGVRLILDFVPNHTALDHPWVFSYPEFYVHGDDDSRGREPESFFLADTIHGRRILAHGRDPYFPAWLDTAQLDFAHPGMRASLIQTLVDIASQCDGVRCDMSMLMLNEVFTRTWGEMTKPADRAAPARTEFWAEAIDAVKRIHPDFRLIAEVYWDLEAKLQALGFDYTYDKGLYDRLLHGNAAAVKEHLHRDFDFQKRSVRFLENHDEARAARAFSPDRHRAAALIAYTLPGMRLFHQGQLDGRKVKIPIQLGRCPVEKSDPEVWGFYDKLLAALGGEVMRRGRWKLLELKPGGGESFGFEQVVIYTWEADRHGSRIVIVNFGPNPARCCAAVDLAGLQGQQRIVLRDLLSGNSTEVDASALKDPGLYFDLAPFEARLLAPTRP